jgi:hypothetical protein
MGHTQLSDTAYYFHLVPEFYPQMIEMGLEIGTNLTAEVPE